MTVKEEDGVKVIKLSETHPEEQCRAADDAVGMLHLWTLLTGGDDLRDTTVVNRSVL